MPYLLLSSAFFIGGIFVVYWLHNPYQLDIVVEPAAPPAGAPLISVCVPARNEERNIRACVEPLLAQDYPNLEVIILDDRSTDRTPVILGELFLEADSTLSSGPGQTPALQIIPGSDLPSDWAGKLHALHQASAAAGGEWLCFVDADTFLAPNTLSACYAKAIETRADMFTIMTFQVLGSFWEKVVMPLVMTALSVGFSPRKVNDPSRRDAIANGQFILIRRSVYDAIGGHESVKDQIVEDKAISEQVKWNGYRLIVADGQRVARTRMYTSLPEMWEGWTKNIYLGLRDQAGLLWLGVFGACVSCADCHMPYVRDGAAKYSTHDVHCPLLNPELACGQCHTDSEYVVSRVNEIQEQVANTKIATEDAIVDAINAIKLAAADPDADADLLDQARNLHRKAQFMWEFVSAENSTGFHNPEYALEILAESTNLARQARMLAAQSVDDMTLLQTGTYYQTEAQP